MKTLNYFKYSLVYTILILILILILLYLTGYKYFNEYVLIYLTVLYIFLAIMCLYKSYKTLKCICYRPTYNLQQASVIASLGDIKTIHSNSSINKSLKSQFGRRIKYNVIPYRRKI